MTRQYSGLGKTRKCQTGPYATQQSFRRVAVVVGLALLFAFAACGGGSSAPDGFAPQPMPPGSSGSGGGNAGSPGIEGPFTDAAAGDAALPPEVKTEGHYQSPVATGTIVWIANPASGRVAYIDAKSFAVQTIEAGDGPTYLAAVPDPTDDVAIVLNVRSRDATLLRDHQGTLSSKTFATTADANSWTVSASGRWAIAWTDAALVANANSTQGFQDLAVLDLSGARPPTVLSVGYRPSKVAFSGDLSRAFAVTQDGISVVDLLGGTQARVTQNFPLAASVPPAPARWSARGGHVSRCKGPQMTGLDVRIWRKLHGVVPAISKDDALKRAQEECIRRGYQWEGREGWGRSVKVREDGTSFHIRAWRLFYSRTYISIVIDVRTGEVVSFHITPL